MTPLDLVGRADAVRELISAWDRVPRETTHGGPQTVVITGEAGVGKSRLISAAVDTIREHDASVTVLSASARVHSPAPYDRLARQGS